MATKWEEWYNTPEGKEYYNKYLGDIPGISANTESIKNAYYSYVETIYKTQDGIINTIKNSSTFFKVAVFCGIVLFVLINLSKIKKEIL